MSQRLVAACIAVPAVLALLVYASVSKLPYATYAPGGTVDILGSDPANADAEIIQVDGAEIYPDDDGQLLMTTVRVSPPAADDETEGENLLGLLTTWADGDSGVYPYEIVHPGDETPESNREQGQIQMTSSQDAAVLVALTEMDVEVPQVIQVIGIEAGRPADGVLEVGDVIRSVQGTTIDDAQLLVDTIAGQPVGAPMRIGITRDGRDRTVEVSPVEVDGTPRVGITTDVAEYDFPFEVAINVPENIGGPSAGLIFSLAVYDTLTEGSLAGGRTIAGTGEIYPNGQVGPIGGIQQKVATARDQGADLFLVPIQNCADALEADNGDTRLVMAQTMHDVRVALEAYAADDGAALPSCEDAEEILEGAAP